MNRRTFTQLMTTGLVGARTSTSSGPQQQSSASPVDLRRPTRWPDQVYRRVLVDIHIPDWHPELLSRFDPAEYVRTVAEAGFQSLMQYAISCAGLCLWRTKIGEMHNAMKGRDFFGEVIEACKRHKIHPTCYFHVVWDNLAYEKHPDWRVRPGGGDQRILEGRFGYACMNSPYRDYVFALLRELVANYEFEAIFNDMIFWPGPCYCTHCTTRFWREHKAEPPRIVDWNDPVWRAFHKARQRWLFEFAKTFTDTVKSVRPIPVTHTFSLYSGWWYGQPLEVAEASDYSSMGDWPPDPTTRSMACKGFLSLSRSRPFEFITARCRNVAHHVTQKPLEEMRIHCSMPMIHSSAYMLIDGINPDGTLSAKAYEFLKKVNEQQAPYEPFLGGEPMADVAVYFDKDSVYNPEESGTHIRELRAASRFPHQEGFLGTGRILREAHVPFGVVTSATLHQLKKYRAVIAPHVLEMTAEQAAQFRSFVEQGGVLYASHPTSLDRFDKRGPHYLLEDVFGVRYKGQLGSTMTYLTPRDAGVEHAIWPQDHLSFRGPMAQVQTLPGTEVLATVTLPFVPPEQGKTIGSRFASIITDPPASRPGADPGIVVNSFGRGKAVWVAAAIESMGLSFPYPDPTRPFEQVNLQLVVALLKRVLRGPFFFELDAHPSVEMTLFHQPEKRRLLAGLLNSPLQMPPTPVEATVRVQVPEGRRALAVTRVPDRKAIPFEKVGPYVQFRIEPFNVLAMVLVEYQ